MLLQDALFGSRLVSKKFHTYTVVDGSKTLIGSDTLASLRDRTLPYMSFPILLYYRYLPKLPDCHHHGRINKSYYNYLTSCNFDQLQHDYLYKPPRWSLVSRCQSISGDSRDGSEKPTITDPSWRNERTQRYVHIMVHNFCYKFWAARQVAGLVDWPTFIAKVLYHTSSITLRGYFFVFLFILVPSLP